LTHRRKKRDPDPLIAVWLQRREKQRVKREVEFPGIYTQGCQSGVKAQGRFKAILVERDGYLLELSRYVALNPVRAG
jgi:coproporphyrinogen III oxidase